MADDQDNSQAASEVRDNVIEWAPRPKYKASGATAFTVNDQVYLKVGSTLEGPYLVAKVVRRKVYLLSDENGDPVNNGAEVVENYLQPV